MNVMFESLVNSEDGKTENCQWNGKAQFESLVNSEDGKTKRDQNLKTT